MALWALFLWSYKETAGARLVESPEGFLRGPRSDYLAAALIGVLTFSKPTHAILMVPVGLLILSRRQWRRLPASSSRGRWRPAGCL